MELKERERAEIGTEGKKGNFSSSKMTEWQKTEEK
jgi:hypothetical protein